MLDLARLKKEVVRMDFHARRFETDFDLDAAGSGARVKIKKRMLVANQFLLHFLQEFVRGN
jgi:hypothetical protein